MYRYENEINKIAIKIIFPAILIISTRSLERSLGPRWLARNLGPPQRTKRPIIKYHPGNHNENGIPKIALKSQVVDTRALHAFDSAGYSAKVKERAFTFGTQPQIVISTS